MDWFKILNEFNGSSAGNCFEESVLPGRLRTGGAPRLRPDRPRPADAAHHRPGQPRRPGPAQNLLAPFARQGVKVRLKDFTLDMPVPTVAALAYDPGTFPHASEIVFTAGTAASPAKAAIRALTEVAQLAGDFESA